MSYKKRTPEEIESMLREFAQGASLHEICEKYSISQSGLYRALAASRGVEVRTYKEASQSQVKKLEKTLKEREKEIALLKSALKKS